jgi:ABC-type dipeptide/oligopeptide/nickel transport system permease subunit
MSAWAGLTDLLPARDPKRRFATAGLIVLAVLAVLAAAHRELAPYTLDQTNTGPVLASGSMAHLFGTDALGRDMLSETLYALAISMSDACVGFLVAMATGMLLGFAAGHLLGRFGIAVRVFMGVAASIPPLLLALLLSAAFNRGSVALAVGLATAPFTFVRVYDRVRAFLVDRHSIFAHAGAEPMTLFRRDVIYEFHDLLAMSSARAFGSVAITLATMSFFGFGAAPPARDLGLMIASAQSFLPNAWWVAAAPALTLIVLVLAARLAAGLAENERP